MKKAGLFVAAFSALLLPLMADSHAGVEHLVWVGALTSSGGKGIYVYRFDSSNGQLRGGQLAAATENPAFLALHPNGRFLYAVNHLGEQTIGSVTAFAIDAGSGSLRRLNQVSTRGFGPCHLAVEQTGRTLAVANYASGSVVTLPIHEDGSLAEASGFVQNRGSSVDPARQQGPHAHCVTFSPGGGLLFVSDLGLDRVLAFRVSAAHPVLEPDRAGGVSVKPGAGPRHFVFHPSGHYAYVLNEMDSSIVAFTFDSRSGTLSREQEISTLPPGSHGYNHAAEIQIDETGEFLYASNRGRDSIAVFSIDAGSGRLRLIDSTPSGGKIPVHFAIDPSGLWLLTANQDSNNLSVLRRDPATGLLTGPVRQISISLPQCVLFAGR